MAVTEGKSKNLNIHPSLKNIIENYKDIPNNMSYTGAK
jgi:hypothetical protein